MHHINRTICIGPYNLVIYARFYAILLLGFCNTRSGVNFMASVAQLLEDKDPTLHTIAPGDSVFNALGQMAEHNIGALPVVEKGKLVGLISERDYARKVILHGHTSRELKVREIMSVHVMCASPDDDVEHCMAIMTEKRVRHLPVLEKGKLIGLVSIGDLVKSIIGEQQFVIEQMTNYIAG